MKHRVYYILLGGLAIVGTVFFFSLRVFPSRIKTPMNTPAPTGLMPKESLVNTVVDDGHTIAYVIQQAHPQNVSLYSNLDAATTSARAREIHACTTLVNAGFYTKEMTHLGRFSGTERDYGGTIESALVDGFLSIDQESRVSIGFDEPEEDRQIVLQSGPIIRRNMSVRPLRLIEDKFARRIAAGVSDKGNLIFMALYFPDQEFSGPLLARVPYIIDKIAQKEQLIISNAINLDGGSASAFISPNASLTELNPIGGYFCIKS